MGLARRSFVVSSDTIAAIATPPGTGGIGLIRISGPRSEEIACTLFKPRGESKSFKSHHLYHGHIITPATSAILDEVLLTIMRGPRSYTGEDTVEISCHGGSLITETVLGEILKSGARLAEPGEFTKRAFLNNRIDLTQAEAVLDLIMAKTDKARELALSQLTGDLSRKIENIRTTVRDILAAFEAAIDFPEDDAGAPFLQPSPLLDGTLQATIDEINSLVSTYEAGGIYRMGINAVITGKPNVGKSSLLNSLLGRKRAIVTPLPGTTRDFIEESLIIAGIPFRLTDTAGIRTPENMIEKAGIDFVQERLALADVVIVVLDGSNELTNEDRNIGEINRARNIIPVINKADLPHRIGSADVDDLFPGMNPLWISAKFGDGIPNLKEALHAFTRKATEAAPPVVFVTNLRHKIALEKTAGLLAQATEGIRQASPPELISLDIREALETLGEITGKTSSEEILDRIFSSFCIGK
jgi:tRNA modification GTPase